MPMADQSQDDKRASWPETVRKVAWQLLWLILFLYAARIVLEISARHQ
jgi:hypothetical protein